jgi:hypothetical protein
MENQHIERSANTSAAAFVVALLLFFALSLLRSKGYL